jgi:hypothetical protein
LELEVELVLGRKLTLAISDSGFFEEEEAEAEALTKDIFFSATILAG